MMADTRPGLVALLGSGETSPAGGRLFEEIARRIPRPPRIAVLETPAGFELNSARVAGRIADFLRLRLQNCNPGVVTIPARKRNTAFSPDDPALASQLLEADLIFMGPGSPTYAARQLQDSRAWHTLIARHRIGAALVFASAATIAIGRHVLPVYEIYKAGEELHWRPGLDLFGAYGLSLVIVSHWNNAEGGADLDTSRCFMGQTRFAELIALLPPDTGVVGINEHTAMILDFGAEQCHVMGHGSVTLINARQEEQIGAGQSFPLTRLGPFRLPRLSEGLPADIVEEAQAAPGDTAGVSPLPPAEVVALVEERQMARARRDWALADTLRQRIAEVGWRVLDTPEGSRLEPR